jgi:hypothetical protein
MQRCGYDRGRQIQDSCSDRPIAGGQWHGLPVWWRARAGSGSERACPVPRSGQVVKRILRKHGYSPDKQEKATQTVLEQAALLSTEWATA